MITTRIAKEIRKSTKLVITEPAGIIRRGKYTLETRFAFWIRLLLDSVIEVEKNCQGSIAAYTSTLYGAAPTEGNFAILLNTTVKTTMVNIGRTNAHAMPMTVCL